jgi:(p)ppGpp synthase/HD superfamily hydrolase
MMEFWQTRAVHAASVLAAKAHDGQLRDDGLTPYIIHPARVAVLVVLFGGQYTEVIAAWLHDVIEDCSHGETTVAYGLSSLKLPGDDAITVYQIIKALTKDKSLEKEQRLPESLQRILAAPPGATLVKLCDRLDNVLDIPMGKKDRQKYLQETEMLLTMLFGRAVESGYGEAHEMLRVSTLLAAREVTGS